MENVTFRYMSGSNTLGIKVNEKETIFVTGRGTIKLRHQSDNLDTYHERVITLSDDDIDSVISTLQEIREFRAWDKTQQEFTVEDEFIVEEIALRRKTTQAPKAVVGALLRPRR